MDKGRAFFAVLAVLALSGCSRSFASEPGHAPSAAHDDSGWTLWYEDEDFEDCGLAAMAGEPHAAACVDVWQRAKGPFASYNECASVMTDYKTRSDEEWQCTVQRPQASNDDSDTGSGGKP